MLILCLFLCVQSVCAEETTEKLSKQIIEESTKESTEENVKESTEENVEESTEEFTEKTMEESAEETVEEEVSAVEITAPSALLMESSTGQVIFEKDADSKRPPASVTKIMTMLLIFDALEEGKIKLTDEVTTSEYAASMGGSQVFLEPGEVQTVDTLIKCISVASANDGCVAMAEYICGSEEEFVSQMNVRAKGLGMTNTHFENCNGLDAEGHLTTARDIALMSRELITKYPQIRDYCMIWQENITHTTRKGSSEFGLSNTNKLVRHYEYATGLKTGSTSQAKFCISATGEKNGVEMISVIMAADDSKKRNADAVKLLNYGFGKCQLYIEETAPEIENVEVKRGTKNTAAVAQAESFSYVDVTGADLKTLERKEVLKKEIQAPVKKGDVAGEVKYYLNGEEIGSVNVIFQENVDRITYGTAFRGVAANFFRL